MAVEIPHDVALFLNYAGVPYPDINEDQVRALGAHVRNFADGVASTHDTANRVIKDMGKVYSGYSYRALVAAWGRMSKSHMANLDAACHVVATALDTAAVVIKMTKIAVLDELAGLAASYAAAMTAAIATDGLFVAIEQAITAAARKICQVMEQVLIGYILSEVIGKAIEPLEHAIDRMVRGIVDDVADELLGPPLGSTEQPLYIEPDEVINYSDALDRLAGEIGRQASAFADKVAGLDFTSPTFDDGGDGMHVVDPYRGEGSRVATEEHTPPSVTTTSTTDSTGVQGAAHLPSGYPLSSGNLPNHSRTPVLEGPAEATGHRAHLSAARLPRPDALPNMGTGGVQPNPETSDPTSRTGGGHVTASPDGWPPNPAAGTAGTSPDGPTARTDSGFTAQHDHGDTRTHNPVSDPQSPWRAAASEDPYSAMGPDRARDFLESLAQAGVTDDPLAPSRSDPATRAGGGSDQRITPWRKSARSKAVRRHSTPKAAPASGTPWAARTAPPSSEPTVFAQPEARSAPWLADRPTETTNTPDTPQTEQSKHSSAHVAEK
ncbi:WXG100-like domain-containing protein [Nocardia sp. CDC160]|uniref:WXG100-like domain-containing protein n=1 Tax=Nocardia sp. CDC160 TaxID=3112166 RepID=UPI002DB6B7EA|nr:hypothetical protein [Nocardia sp. CDC160]MEC3920269.1 hypothetical protein [Nocardia sp. CDC160]